MSSTVHFGKGRSMTFGDPEYVDPTVSIADERVRTEMVRVPFDRATHARLKLIARAEHKSLTDFIRRLAEDRARVQSIYAHGKHTT